MLQPDGIIRVFAAPQSGSFDGIVPGAATTPVSQITLHVTFGTWENFYTDTLQFEVADFEIA
jgi:hypothetical protein